ncbi:MAG: hypothetical protein CMD31_10960 [Flavobacteriales bacterium]|jgi:hypothetical protein|nr:hypothetical protein [Flavobacteriales bacterium]|tara:strand:- start:49567 stop:49878 length:312 start_codon:yes stop_codon:yes gene_type:complete
MQAPRIPKMFGIYTKKPSQFEYTPRYYDERKEKLEKRIAQIKKEVENEKNPTSTSEYSNSEYQSRIREDWGNGYARRNNTGMINKRVLIYLGILLALTYYLFY